MVDDNRMKPQVALCLAGLLAGCLASGASREKAMTAVRVYSDAVRWSKYEDLEKHLGTSIKNQRMTALQDVASQIDFLDYEVLNIKDATEKPKEPQVKAQVEYTWSLRDEGVVKKTNVTQTWILEDGHWVIDREERRGGAPLKLFSEPEPKAVPRAPTP